jgi:hypothetical protein
MPQAIESLNNHITHSSLVKEPFWDAGGMPNTAKSSETDFSESLARAG